MSINKSDKKVLHKVSTITRPAIDLFDVNKYLETEEINAEFDLWSIQIFALDDHRMEKPVPEAKLRIHQFIDDFDDKPIVVKVSDKKTMKAILTRTDDISIITRLGGEEVAEITLGRIFEMIKAQNRGQEGILLVDGHVNVSYVRDTKGILQRINFYYYLNHHWRFMSTTVSNIAWTSSFQIISY